METSVHRILYSLCECVFSCCCNIQNRLDLTPVESKLTSIHRYTHDSDVFTCTRVTASIQKKTIHAPPQSREAENQMESAFVPCLLICLSPGRLPLCPHMCQILHYQAEKPSLTNQTVPRLFSHHA